MFNIYIHPTEETLSRMVGHSFQNYDTIYVGFLSRILVKISYIWAFIPRIRPFSTHIRGLQGPIYARAKMRVYAIT